MRFGTMLLIIAIVLVLTGCSIKSTYSDPAKDVLWHPDNLSVTFWAPDNRVRITPKFEPIPMSTAKYDMMQLHVMRLMHAEVVLLQMEKEYKY